MINGITEIVSLANNLLTFVGGIRELTEKTEVVAAPTVAEDLDQHRELLETIKKQIRAAEEQLSELHGKLRQMKDTLNDLSEYREAYFGLHSAAMIRKDETDPNKPSHLCCINCAKQTNRTIMSPTDEVSAGHRVLRCSQCKTAVYLPDPALRGFVMEF